MKVKLFSLTHKYCLGMLIFCAVLIGCTGKKKEPGNGITIKIYTDSMVSEMSHHPVGIKIDDFMDGDRYPNGQELTTKALKEMGVKYLRYPGGDKSDLNLFSVAPYEKASPHLARTGKGAVDDYVNVLTNYND